MDATANSIESTIEEINSLLDSMKSHVGNISGNWTDENGKSFNERFDELKSEMPSYIDKGHAAAAFMKGVSNAYRESIRVNSRAVNNDGQIV